MNYYDDNAQQYFEATKNADMTDAYKRFCKYIEKGSYILDIGCGSGRDLKFFNKHGYIAEGLEPSKKLCNLIRTNMRCKIYCDSIQSFMSTEPYNAIWACASLLHLTPKEILDFFKHIDKFLFSGGIIYVSGKNGIETGVNADGRYFCEFSEKLLEDILECNSKLTLIEKWYSADVTGRNDFQWMNFILSFDKLQ